MNIPDDQPSMNDSVGNPFVVESPEKVSPQRIVDLFVEKYTQIETIKQRKHTFIWGSRGSGKSMMLRYLEPQCQAIVHGGIAKFLGSASAYLAVYCPCKEGYFNKSELHLLPNNVAAIITEHMLNLYIAGRLIDCLSVQFPEGFLPKDVEDHLAESVLQLYDRASIAASVDEASAEVKRQDAPLDWLQALFRMENRKTNVYLRQTALRGSDVPYGGTTSGYHDFLLPFMKAIKSIKELNSLPVYVLLDDADRLARQQQLIVNSWIANRDQEFVCLKVASEFDGYKTFRKMDELFGRIDHGDQDLYIEQGGVIESPHDYSEVNVDELYTAAKADYAEKVRLIANRRLELYGLDTRDIREFLPQNPTEARVFDEIRKEAANEWEKVGKPGDRDDYVYRYATARLFQHLRATKKRKSYAGFANMVHLSAGVIRGFLEPCYFMFDRYLSKKHSAKSIRAIPPEIQDDVLFQYSEEFLAVDLEKIRKDLPPERYTHLEALSTLLESLGRLFYERLHDPESREARLFSFTVRGPIPQESGEVLRMGVRYRYFQRRTYSTKEGGGREKWYILNRRLCPVFKLDPTGFEGRISLTPELLRLACENPERFVRLRLQQDERQLDMFSLVE